MKTVVFDLDRRIRLCERPDPPLTDTGVLIKPSFAGICGTDLHAEVLDHFRPGVVMGHEFSGRVLASGRSAHRFAEGDVVVVNPNGNRCDQCPECLSGHSNLCSSAVFKRGVGIHEDGGMAELVVVDERTLFAVPPTVTETDAAWTEPLATAVRAVSWTALGPESVAVVIGAGPIGLLVIQLLGNLGVSQIEVVEPSPYRRRIATQLGATSASAPVGRTQETHHADVIFECSGSTQGFLSAPSAVRAGGTIVVIGLAPTPLAIDPFALVGREVTIQGSIIYDDADFKSALTLLETGAIDVETLTTDVMALDEYAEAFRLLRDPEAATKILLQPR
jgi:L-iditol 2-dehydrogenase